MTRITVSFKQTTRDMKLYTMVKNLEEQSDFIKDAIEFYLKETSKDAISSTTKTQNFTDT